TADIVEWVPTDKSGTAKVATPPATVPVPSVAAPSLKVTVPLFGATPGAVFVTVAVKTTWPKTDGLALLPNAVVVLDELTVWFSADDVLPATLVSPPYTAVML